MPLERDRHCKFRSASVSLGFFLENTNGNQEPDEVELLTRQSYALFPRIKITDFLVEVDEWTGFTRHFVHLRNGETAKCSGSRT
jgi:hypothetical protein